MLEVHCESISLDEVAVNDIPTYRPLHLRNTTDAPLSVSLSASSPLLRFQLRNENYEAIQRVGLRDFLSVYNEAFDVVGLISTFSLAAHEEREIVTAFRADPAAFTHLAAGAPAAPFTGTVNINVSGTPRGAPSSPLTRPAQDFSASITTGSSSGGGGGGAVTAAGTITATTTEDAATTTAAAAAAAGTTAVAQPQTESYAIPFRANVYVSFLKLSAPEIQVTMAPNKTQVADFVVTNTSCQPVLFLIRDQAMPLKGLDVALYEADKFEDPKLGHRILLDSYASMTFSLMLRSAGANPTAQVQYHTVLQCDNLRDTRNTNFLYVSVSVGAESRGDLVGLSETSIDFGDVYRGTKAFAQVRVQNIDGREDAVVRLGDADRGKYGGKFSLMKGDVAVDEVTVTAQKGNPFTAITLLYQPSHDADSREAAKKKFEVELLAQSATRKSSQRIVLRCSATLYTSNIVVSQRSVNFGDCQVGQSKRYTLQIENRSPLQGKVVVQLRSKIIQMEGIPRTSRNTGRELCEEFTIGPSASLPLTLRITPQRVNPMYRKQLTIINASNPAEDRQVINIEANNMAPLDTKLHDELYSWKCDLGGSNSSTSTDAGGLHSGPSTLWAVSNVPLLVPYSVQSKVSREVVLHLRSSSPEIEVFYAADPAMWERLAAITAEFRRICLYGEGEDSSYLTNESAEQLFKAREELVNVLSETSRNITNRITLEPNAVLKAYALIIRTASPTEPLTKEDGISIAVDGIEAPRFVRLSYRLCASTFEFNGQKTKNFGEVNIGVKKTTKLPIVNRCNSFLFLHLTKSRSVTAEHIRMEHSEKQSIFLTIRPYASREIELTLYPGIKGVLQEKIRVVNILNIENAITMTIKAVVTKADTFEISPDSWTFEMMVPPSASAVTLMAPSLAPHGADDSSSGGGGGGGGSSGAGGASNARVGAKFTVSNTSNARRQILARVELSNANASAGATLSNPYLAFPGVKVAVQLDMTLTGASSVSTRKLEEQIEKLEQKLKIYLRKKKTEKAENAQRKIEAYRLALKGEEVDLVALESTQSGAHGSTDHELSESEDEGGTSALQALKSRTQQNDIVQLLRREGVPLPSMGAGESVMITLFLVCKRVLEEPIPVTQSQTMNILFYEARDQEANRIIPIDMVLMRTPGDTLPHQLPAAADDKMLAVAPSLVKAIGVQGLAGGAEAQRADGATNPLTAPAAKGAGGSAVTAATRGAAAVRPPPTIRLTTTGAGAGGGGGRFPSTFMGHPLLVLRNCIVNDQTEFSFLVEADSDTTIVVLEPRRCGGSVPEVLDARFKLFPRNGHVRHLEPLRIVVECTARSVGPQKYFIPVKNIRNAADVRYLTVEMNPTEEVDMLTTEPKELFFRDVLTPCAPAQLEAQVVLIRSRFPFPHALVVRTNKPSQLSLFEDASCTIPLLHPIRRIFAKETVRVYVQLRPGARYVDPRARNIHAGVLVEAVAPNPAVSGTAYCIVGKAVLRAVACVGSAIVEVSQRSLELGCVPSSQHYVETELTLHNTSHSFALRIALVPSTPSVDVVEEPTHGDAFVLAPLQTHAIPVVLHLPSPGLAQEYIDVVNRSSAQETIRVTLSALRLNDGIVQVEPPLNTPLTFPMAAVVRGESGEELRLHQPVSCSVRMANYHSNREVVLAATAVTATPRDLPLRFHTADEEAQVRTAFAEEQRQAATSDGERDSAANAMSGVLAATPGTRSGTTAPTSTPTSSNLLLTTYVKGRVELQANRAQVVMWTLTDLPALTPEEVQRVLQHQLVTITATMQVCVTYTAHSAKTTAAAGRSHQSRYRGPAVGQCVLLVPVTLSFAMSEGRAEPAVVNLGLVAKPTSPPASPTSATAEASSDDDDGSDADDGAAVTAAAAQSGTNEEAVFAARVRRRRRVRVAQLRRPGNHQQFSSYSTKTGLQSTSSHDMVVSFHLMNLSSVMPLPLKVECPPVIRFSQTRLTLPPGASTTVEATLNLKLITTQGSFRYEAFFVNEWNPENDMAVCITGQHYWKVFKVLRSDTEEELRDAVTLAPLRLEPSLVAPLSELKLAFLATEPDVEFDLRVQPNPQLDGLLELLLLHYDATSAATHLSFRSDAQPASAGVTAASGATTSGGTTVSGSAGPGASTATGLAAAAAAAVSSASATAASLPPPSIGGMPAPTSATGAGSGGSGMHSTIGASTTAGEEATAGSAGSQATSPQSTAAATANAVAANAAASAASAATVANAAPTNLSAGAKLRKSGAGGLSTAAGGGGGAGGAAAAAPARSQRLRLRCMLRSGDLASLVSLFYGFRRSRTNAAAALTSDAAAPGTATTSAVAAAATTTDATGGSSSGSSALTWNYDRIAELERRSAALVSNNVWLGTVWVANPFTEDEELQVYSTLGRFRTFSAPSKLSLRPSRVSVEAPRWATQADVGRPAQIGYVGEVTVTNDFDLYVAELSVVVVVSDRLGVPLEIDVRGGTQRGAATTTTTTLTAGSGAAGALVSLADTVRSDATLTEMGSTSALGGSVATVPTSVSTPAPAATAAAAAATSASAAATSFIATGGPSGAPPVSQPHCVQLGPHETVVLTVVVRPLVSATTTSSSSTPPLSLTALEQHVSVVVVDDNIPFSYQVSKVNIVTSADSAETLPTVTLSASPALSQSPAAPSTPGVPPPLSSSPPLANAPATATASVGGRESTGHQQQCPTPPSSEPLSRSPMGTDALALIPNAGTATATGRDDASNAALTPTSRHSSTHTSHATTEEGGAALPPVSTAAADADAATAVDASVGDGVEAGSDAGASAAAAGESHSATMTRSVSPALPSASTATTAAGTVTTDNASGAAAAPRHWVLSLRNCDPLPGSGGAYTSNFSVARDDTYEPGILIRNHLPSTSVRYTVQVVSQSPQVWLLLTSTTGVLEGGETHPLRLQVLSSDVGSFVGYVAVTNAHDTREVIYLRISAEIFVPGTAEGLFDVIAMNGGNRLTTTSAVHNVDMGALYGAGTTRSLIALEIVNRGNVALEFPVSVVHPMRQELRPIPRTMWYGTALTAAGHRSRPSTATTGRGQTAAAAATTPRPSPPHSETKASTPTSLSASSLALSGTPAPTAVTAAATTATTGTAASNAAESPSATHEMPVHALAPQRSPHSHHHHHSRHHRGGVLVGGTTTSSAAATTAAAMNAASASPFDGKLVVCHIHSVPLRTGQKYFVVDPRSPLRLAFLLTCNALHDIPDGYGVYGSADVVFKCKQARDAHFTFNVRFEAFKPTFSVALEYDMDAVQTAAAAAAPIAAGEGADHTQAGTLNPPTASLSSSFVPLTSRALRPNATSTAASSASSRYAETEVAVTNLSRTHAQVFVLFSQSEVLTLSTLSRETPATAPPGSQLLPPLSSGAAGSEDGSGGSVAPQYVTPSTPAVEVVVAPQSVGVFVVRLDRLRAEALLNFDKDESKLARPALCEHAYLYNKGNPRERVQLLFRQHAVSVQPQRSGRLDVALTTTGPVSPTRADAKPVKGNSTQHFSERHIVGFAQRFAAMLTSLADSLPFMSREGDAGSEGVNSGGGVGDQTSVLGGTKTSAGDYAAAVGGGGGNSAAASAFNSVLRSSVGGGSAVGSGAATPGRPHRTRPAQQGRHGIDTDVGSVVKGGRRLAGLHGSRLDSSDDSSSDDSSITTTSSTSGGGRSESSASGKEELNSSEDDGVGDGDRTLNSTLTEDSNGVLAGTLRDSGGGAEEALHSAGGDSQGPLFNSSAPAETRNVHYGAESERRQRQQTPSALPSHHGRQRGGEASSDIMVFSPTSSASVSTTGARTGPMGRIGGEAKWADALYTLHDLLVELTWLCDELLFYAILLRNSRHVEACGAFLVAAVSQHPVMVAWRRRRGSVSRTREYDVFGRFLDTIDALPRTSNSTS